MSETAGDRAELYLGFDNGEVDPGTRVEDVTRADIADAVSRVADHGDGAVRVEDCLDDPQSLATMCEAWFSEGEWELSYHLSETFTLDDVSPGTVVDVLWQFATADPAFRDAGWGRYSDSFPFWAETGDHVATEIPATDLSVPREVRDALAVPGTETVLHDVRTQLITELTVENTGDGVLLTWRDGQRDEVVAGEYRQWARCLVVADPVAAEQVVASWLRDAVQPPVGQWD